METELNFRIEIVVERPSPLCCTADQKIDSAHRKLDPPLSASDKKNNLTPMTPDACKGTEPIMPMNR